MRYTLFAVAILCTHAIQAEEPAPRAWTWNELQKGLDANVPALSSARVTARFRTQQYPALLPFARKRDLNAGPPPPETGTLRYAWDARGRFRCDLVPDTGDTRTFAAVFDGSATKLHEIRNRVEQFSVLPDLSRAFYAGIEPRDALYLGGNRPIVAFLAKYEPRVVDVANGMASRR